MPATRSVRLAVTTSAAMVAFAANSLLCRQALTATAIDPATFTSLRLASGAAMLYLICRARHRPVAGDWGSALSLFAYAAAFSFAYVSLPAATGALLLFGAVQATMIGYGLWRGERPGPLRVAGMAIAAAGLVALLLPGATAPSGIGAALMVAAGIAWGIYSLRGRGAGEPVAATTGNFVRAVPLAAAVSVLLARGASADVAGAAWAVASGAVASGLGYVLWYAAVARVTATIGATVQLSVPAIAAAGGAVLLGEAIGPRTIVSAVLILGGIALSIRGVDAAR